MRRTRKKWASERGWEVRVKKKLNEQMTNIQFFILLCSVLQFGCFYVCVCMCVLRALPGRLLIFCVYLEWAYNGNFILTFDTPPPPHLLSNASLQRWIVQPIQIRNQNSNGSIFAECNKHCLKCIEYAGSRSERVNRKAENWQIVWKAEKIRWTEHKTKIKLNGA